MLDRSAIARRADRPSVAPGGNDGRLHRRRAFIASAVLALALHAVFLDAVGVASTGSVTEAVATPMSVRALPGQPSVDPVEASPMAAVTVPMLPAPATVPMMPAPAPLRPPSSDAAIRSRAAPAVDTTIASAHLPSTFPQQPSQPAAADPASVESPAGAPPALLAAGERPPPLYRTQLPPSATLHYEVRRGALRGTGQVRWRASGDHYELAFQAHVSGLMLLAQTSEGGIDANGLAPVRFVDRRARRSAQAANFRRDDGRITFSGTGAAWPLLPGSQDRLGWMIQLAAIAAAEPERLDEGGAITMVVVGARGDASVWTLRQAGREEVETATGRVHAVKFVRDARSAYDTSVEIWLDPERSYLPARATLRNNSGAPEYDLLLERVDPAS